MTSTAPIISGDSMTTSIANRALAFILAAIVALVVFGLFAVAMQTGVGMMILLVLCAGALSAILLVAFRGFTATRLTWQIESNRHDEAVLRLGHDPETYQLIERQAQLPAPVQVQPVIHQIEWKPELEKYRYIGIELVAVTISMLGRDSKRIISRGDAQANDAFKGASTVQNAFDFLKGNHLTYVKMNGGKPEETVIENEMTASELMAVLSPARLRGASK